MREITAACSRAGGGFLFAQLKPQSQRDPVRKVIDRLRPKLSRITGVATFLNARHIPWDYYDRPADACMTDNWNLHRETLYRNVGLAS